jgi:hypothetical protein
MHIGFQKPVWFENPFRKGKRIISRPTSKRLQVRKVTRLLARALKYAIWPIFLPCHDYNLFKAQLIIKGTL